MVTEAIGTATLTFRSDFHLRTASVASTIACPDASDCSTLAIHVGWLDGHAETWTDLAPSVSAKAPK